MVARWHGAGLLDAGFALAAETRHRRKRCSSRTGRATTTSPTGRRTGKRIVYTSYRNDAIELWLLELATGSTQALVANGAVNLDAALVARRRKVAYVSTAYEGRFHVFVVPGARRQRVGDAVRITEEHDSGLPRYYYSSTTNTSPRPGRPTGTS